AMAGLAISVWHIGELLEGLAFARGLLVALHAVHVHVATGQLEVGACMIEAARRLPLLHGVALRAIARERSLVLVFVAGEACAIKAHEGLLPVLGLLVLDVVRRV